MNTKNNQRYKDTETLIQNTFLKLAHTTDIRQVTVSSICSMANINRSTFYAHYLDINDLVDQMGKDMMQDISRLFEHADPETPKVLARMLLKRIPFHMGQTFT